MGTTGEQAQHRQSDVNMPQCDPPLCTLINEDNKAERTSVNFDKKEKKIPFIPQRLND